MIGNGIVTSAYAVNVTASKLSISADITPEHLRYFCLYWDEIALIDAFPIRCELDKEKELLNKAGILSLKTANNPDWEPDLGYVKWTGGGLYCDPTQQSTMDPFGQQLVKYLQNDHFLLASEKMGELIKKDPTKWTIHQNGSELILPKEHEVEQLTAKMELKNCLPVPRADIPLETILDFKCKRSDELLALDDTLTELYLKITNSNDSNTASNYYVKKLNNAISDLNIVSNEKFGFCNFANFSVSRELSTASVVGGFTFSHFFEDPMFKLGAFIFGGAASSIKVTATKTKEHKDAIGASQLSYLSSITKCGITPS
ncbi:hypothetical protein HWV00_09760 [Moritella sp. 24]|uniref:DUF6236 family protein n=1 Tax=Moritella sp. 24 TaxID=2746230 RepID=UPI001BA689D8|nr:DUF6236 family protein [Moritella sp. 24]QUM76491.1 hypothetical protein HWV00_09760 [Moritella sp. 24]